MVAKYMNASLWRYFACLSAQLNAFRPLVQTYETCACTVRVAKGMLVVDRRYLAFDLRNCSG